MTEEALHSPESERIVICATLLGLLDPAEAIGIVGASDFYRGEFGVIWSAIAELASSPSSVVDQETVRKRLDQTGRLTAAGGAVMFNDLLDAPTVANPEFHAREVERLAREREIIRGLRLAVDRTLKGEREAANEALHRAAEISDRILTPPEEMPYHFFLGDNSIVTQEDMPKRILGEYLFEGDLSMIHATSGAGKSHLVIQWAASIASGVPFAPEYPVPEWRPIVYLDPELGKAEVLKRRQQYCRGLGVDPKAIPFAVIPTSDEENVLKWEPLNTPIGQRQLVRVLDWFEREFKRKPVLILDGISYLSEHAENSNEEARPFVAFLAQLRARGVTVVLVHHDNKAGDYSGNSMITRPLNARYHVQDVSEEGSPLAKFTVKTCKNRGGANLPTIALEAFGEGLNGDPEASRRLRLCDVPRGAAGASRAEVAEDEVWEYIRDNPSLSGRSILRGLRDGGVSIQEKTFFEVLGRLEAAKRIENHGSAGRPLWVAIEVFDEEDGVPEW